MGKQRVRAVSLLLGMGMLCAGSADAQEGFYFGLAGGVTSLDLISKSNRDAAFATSLRSGLATAYGPAAITSELDDSSKGWGVQIGYRFTSYVAAEVGYVDLGKAVYDGAFQYQDPAPTVFAPAVFDADTRAESSGPMASVLGILPLADGRFDLHARVGVYFADTRVRNRSLQSAPPLPVTVPPTPPYETVSREQKAGSSDLLYGIGGAWNINDNYSLRLEYTKFSKVGDADKTGEGDVDLITFGVLFR